MVWGLYRGGYGVELFKFGTGYSHGTGFKIYFFSIYKSKFTAKIKKIRKKHIKTAKMYKKQKLLLFISHTIIYDFFQAYNKKPHH